MNFINFAESIRTGNFFHDHSFFDFDCVIASSSFDPQIASQAWVSCNSRAELGYDIRPNGACEWILKKSQHPLLILDTLSVEDVLPLMQTYPHLRVISCGAGVSGWVHKLTPDMDDCNLVLSQWWTIGEGYDSSSLLNLIEESECRLIRVMDKQLQEEIFDNPTKNSSSKIINFGWLGLCGDDGSILAFGSMIPVAIEVCATAKEKNVLVDCFGVTELPFALDESLLESVVRTKNVFVLVDAACDSETKKRIAKMVNPNDDGSVELKFVLPTFDKVTTKLEDYVYESAQFDVNAIVQIIADV